MRFHISTVAILLAVTAGAAKAQDPNPVTTHIVNESRCEAKVVLLQAGMRIGLVRVPALSDKTYIVDAKFGSASPITYEIQGCERYSFAPIAPAPSIALRIATAQPFSAVYRR